MSQNSGSIFSWKTWKERRRLARRTREIQRNYPDLTDLDRQIIQSVSPFTMLSPDRLFAFMEATRHVEKAGIPGAIVECGVWKGGAVMSSLLTLKNLGSTAREIYLYDTFEGMPAPGADDKKYDGDGIAMSFEQKKMSDDASSWCRGELSEVHHNVRSTGYAAEKIHFVKGKVEQTIPQTMPSQIAILRLDTDWYESTRHELEHLYPLLVTGGVLIIDDYGHWDGARQAVDEYFDKQATPLLLNRTDYTGRIGVKAA